MAKTFIYIILFAIVLVNGFLIYSLLGETVDLRVIEEKPSNPVTLSGVEQYSPYDWIKEDQILVYPSHVEVRVKNTAWSKFKDTNSMDPVFDLNSNGILITPKKINDIHVGDIISYISTYNSQRIVHRVIEIGTDEQGVYFIAKGDNNLYNDPGRIRFEQIKAVTIGILY